MKRTVIAILILALLLSDISAFASTLTLPASVKVIEEEAFAGDVWLDEVVLPEGLEEIGPRAFADSGVMKINLPESLEKIDDSALPVPAQVTVSAVEGSYAYEWAENNGYIGTEFVVRAWYSTLAEINLYRAPGGHIIAKLPEDTMLRIFAKSDDGYLFVKTEFGTSGYIDGDRDGKYLAYEYLPESITIYVGETYQLEQIDGLRWWSNNDSIATVSSTGLVTGISVGNTVIDMIYGDDYDSSLEVYVIENVQPTPTPWPTPWPTPGPTPGPSVPAANFIVGAWYYVTSNITIYTSWPDITGDPSTIPEGCLVKIIEVLDNDIKVMTEDHVTGSINRNTDGNKLLFYYKAPSLKYKEISIILGENYQLEFDDDSSRDGLGWASSDENIATVTEDGLVTGVNAGTATIYVYAEDVLDTCIVKVLPMEAMLFDKAINENSTEINNFLLRESLFLSLHIYDDSLAEYITPRMSKLGFNLTHYHEYDSDLRHDVRYALYYKIVKDSDNNDMLVFSLIIRGTTHQLEWASNFCVGTSVVHEGFKKATQSVYSNVDSLITGICSAYNINKYKIWITGHSRGAAVGNLMAGDYYKEECQLGNIYAYLFATPNVAKNVISNSSIHNYNMEGDLVPEVPLGKDYSGWEYKRNGETIIVHYDDSDYYRFISQSQLKDILSSIYSYYPTVSKYHDKLEQTIIGKYEEAYRSGQQAGIGNFIDVILSNPGLSASICAVFSDPIEALTFRVGNTHMMYNYVELIQKNFLT